jgi:uncharacterized protein (DUF433 family)
MSLVIESPKVPLETSEDGVIRVGRTRVTLESVVTAFRQGATAEEIAQQYSSLQLVEVYEVIGFYLRRQREVDEYIRQARAQSEAVQQAHEERFSPVGTTAGAQDRDDGGTRPW